MGNAYKMFWQNATTLSIFIAIVPYTKMLFDFT